MLLRLGGANGFVRRRKILTLGNRKICYNGYQTILRELLRARSSGKAFATLRWFSRMNVATGGNHACSSIDARLVSHLG